MPNSDPPPHDSTQAGDHELSLDEATAYYDQLRQHVADQETKFDSAALLIAGGAFTVSAVLLERGQWRWTIFVAWVAWGLCLAFASGSYLLSQGAGRAVIAKLMRGERRLAKLTSWQNDWVILASSVTYLFLVVGMGFFGVYAYQGVRDGSQSTQGNQEEGRPQEVRQTGDRGQQSARAAAQDQAAAKANESKVTHEPKANTPAAQPSEGAGEEGKQPAAPAGASANDDPAKSGVQAKPSVPAARPATGP